MMVNDCAGDVCSIVLMRIMMSMLYYDGYVGNVACNDDRMVILGHGDDDGDCGVTSLMAMVIHGCRHCARHH